MTAQGQGRLLIGPCPPGHLLCATAVSNGGLIAALGGLPRFCRTRCKSFDRTMLRQRGGLTFVVGFETITLTWTQP